MIYNGWKPYASKEYIELYKRGRIGGSDELSIVPMPRPISDSSVFEESGNKHKFKGRITPTSRNTRVSFPTFIVDNIRLTEGNWYYCIKFRTAALAQVGWATTGFTPAGDSGLGVGDDKYSWSYDGSRGTLYHQTEYRNFTSDNIRWKDDDICGCGIEIDDENTKIKYWLNGRLLGTAFTHHCSIGTTITKCNLLPNGRGTTYFPAVSSEAKYSGVVYEFIFSPEDMTECPLPKGYKPLIMPKSINIENSIVAYPYRAYLVGNNVQDYFTTVRSTTASTPVLREFVNEQHLQTAFTVEDHQLRLPGNSDGFSFSLDNYSTSLTISFDFEIQTETETDILLCTLDTPEMFSVRIPLSKVQGETHAAIVFHWNERNAKIYINSECRTFNGEFQNQTMAELHILPNTAAGIKNLAIWKYALPEEHIRRLFTYGLFYVAIDYQQLSEYRKQANAFTFVKNQQHFSNGLLVPFNQPFEESIWLQKKKQIDSNESNYFRTISETDGSVVQLFGNQSYLVLEKSIESWSQYTLIFDILCPSPINGERLTLIAMNSQSEIYITDYGKIYLSSNEMKTTSESMLKLNEYIRLVISVDEKSLRIYANGLLMLAIKSDSENLTITTDRIDLFREIDLTRNTTDDDTLRIECKSITYLNRSLVDGALDERMKSPKHLLEPLVAPPFSLIVSSLIAIGYNVTWIKSVMKQCKTENIQLIDTWIRETKEELHEKDLEDRPQHYFTILSRLSPSIDQEKIQDLLTFLKFDTNEEIAAAGDLMIAHWKDLQTSKSSGNDKATPSDNTNWYHQTVVGLDINESLHEWIQGNQLGMEDTDLCCQLFDLKKYEPHEQTTFATSVESQRKRIQKSMQYSHRQISQKQYLNSYIACEHELTSIYARYTVLNMLKVWSSDNSSLFPLEKFGDCEFIITLLRLMDYHYTYTSTNMDENIDRMSVLVNSILRIEIKELLKLITTTVQNKTNSEILSSKAPLLYQLQKDIMAQSIHLLSKRSLLLDDSNNEATTIDEHTMIKKPNLNFVYKILQLFVELITNKSTMKQHEIDSLIPLLLPLPLINVMFDLFLADQAHQSKVFILHLFVT
ncbi:unnamed protein product [Rotaria sp. Silwood2]|nr:unnamed protein product [Rotaria sp. Silwood2]